MNNDLFKQEFFVRETEKSNPAIHENEILLAPKWQIF